MKMRTLRRIKKLQAKTTTTAPRLTLRRRFDLTDVSSEHDASPAPEAVFDRITGPYGRAYAQLGCFDEET
jgi:hypothetical protein